MLMGGAKVFIHDAVREADFCDGATVNAYRAELARSHRFRFDRLSCPSFDSEAEASQNLAGVRTALRQQDFAEFVYPRL